MLEDQSENRAVQGVVGECWSVFGFIGKNLMRAATGSQQKE